MTLILASFYYSAALKQQMRPGVLRPLVAGAVDMERQSSTSNGYGEKNNPQRRNPGRPVKWPGRKAYKEDRSRVQKDLRRQESIDKKRLRLVERPVRQVHDSKTPTSGSGQSHSRMFRRNRLTEVHNDLLSKALFRGQPRKGAETSFVCFTVASADGGEAGGCLPV